MNHLWTIKRRLQQAAFCFVLLTFAADSASAKTSGNFVLNNCQLRTVQTPVVNGIANSIVALTLDSYFDPLVEFQELAVAVNGQRTWKVMGPDLNGHYGGLNGVGGLEATIRESDGTVTPVLNDYFGNVLATISGTTASWNSVRVGGYGPVLGYEASPLTAGTPLAESLLWRSRRIDPSGFYNLGARYYDPMAGRFLSPDPMGHAGSMDLYSAFNGDPVNNFDPDGRFSAGSLNGAEQYGSELYASLGNALDAVIGGAGGHQADSRYQFNYMNGSDAYQAGSDFGYTAAGIGLQVGLIAATEGLAELAPALEGAGALDDANIMRIGGTMALRTGEEGVVAETEAETTFTVAGTAGTSTASSGAGQSVTINVNSAEPTYAPGETMPNGQVAGVGPGAMYSGETTIATRGAVANANFAQIGYNGAGNFSEVGRGIYSGIAGMPIQTVDDLSLIHI